MYAGQAAQPTNEDYSEGPAQTVRWACVTAQQRPGLCRFLTDRHLPHKLQAEAVSMSSEMLRQEGSARYFKHTGLSRMPTTDDQVRQLWKSVLMNKGDELWPEGPHAKLFENPVARIEGLNKIINRHKQSGVDLPRY